MWIVSIFVRIFVKAKRNGHPNKASLTPPFTTHQLIEVELPFVATNIDVLLTGFSPTTQITHSEVHTHLNQKNP